MDQHGREEAFLDRREILADCAEQLRRLARSSWRRPLATFGLGIAGSAVTLAYGHPIAAGLTKPTPPAAVSLAQGTRPTESPNAGNQLGFANRPRVFLRTMPSRRLPNGK